MNNSISRLSDLHHLTCGVLKGSESEQIALRIGVNTEPYETIDEALRAMIGKKIDATVADKISLMFLQRQFAKETQTQRFEIPEFSIRNSFLAIPVRSNHPDYGKINQCLLDLTSSNDWEPLVNRWIGHGYLSL